MIVSRLLRSAIKATGAIDTYEPVDPTAYEDALEACNMMLNLWSARGHIIYHVITETLTLTAGKGDYTIGVTTGDLNTVRPNEIIGGFTRDSDNSDYPLKVLTREEYNGIISKNVSSRPKGVYYYPTFPLGTLYFDYVPDKAYTLSLDSLKPLTSIASIEADLNLPPQYEEAIKWNLAVRLCPDYRRPATAEMAQFAKGSYDALGFQPVPKATFEGVPGVSCGAGKIFIGE